MNNRMLLQLVLAFGLAAVAGFMVWRFMNEQAARPAGPQAQIETHPVVVAAGILEPGRKITAELVRIVQFPVNSIPSKGFENPQDVIDRVVLSPMSAGEPVTEPRLASDEISIGGISALVHPGKRAMAVQGNKVIGMSGFIRPGNRIDVMVTMENKQTKDRPMTRVVLENVPVLATGTQLVPSEDGKEPSPVDVYTLEVTPQEGELLALAAARGDLHFALRNTRDTGAANTDGASVEKALGMGGDVAPRPRTYKRAGSRVSVRKTRVEIISGTEKSVKTFTQKITRTAVPKGTAVSGDVSGKAVQWRAGS